MNRGSIEKLALLCAAAGITPAEWEDFLAEVRQSGSDETRRLYNRVRSQLRSIEKAISDTDMPANGSLELTSSSVFRDVNRLIDQADVSTPTAARRLSTEMGKQFPDFDPELFRFNAKDGLRRWLNKLIREYGESAVLSAASSAFRERQGTSDWRLGT